MWWLTSAALAAEIPVAVGEDVQAALNSALPGDELVLAAGTHTGPLVSAAAGEEGTPIVIRGEEGAEVVLSAEGTVLTLSHAWLRVEGLILDGNYGAGDTLIIDSAAQHAEVFLTEVRHSGRDCVDIGDTLDVWIASSTIHHCLWYEDGRAEANGITAGAVAGLTLSGVTIHSFSGDGLLIDPDRADPGWSDVLIEDSDIYLEPLEAEAAGYPAGEIPGEDGLETRTPDTGARSALTLRDSRLWGFANPGVDSPAALHIKENVQVTIEQALISESTLGLRLRGPDETHATSPELRLVNSALWGLGTGLLVEGSPAAVELLHLTFGPDNLADLYATEGYTFSATNSLFLSGALPDGISAESGNVAADISAVVDAAGGDFHLIEGSPAIDAGVELADVTEDFEGTARPQGAAWDAGADELGSAGDTGGGDSGQDSGTPGLDSGLITDSGEPEVPRTSASMDAGEKGGVHCTSAPLSPAAHLGWLGLLCTLGLRRRR
jgi:hypothetical protein